MNIGDKNLNKYGKVSMNETIKTSDLIEKRTNFKSVIED